MVVGCRLRSSRSFGTTAPIPPGNPLIDPRSRCHGSLVAIIEGSKAETLRRRRLYSTRVRTRERGGGGEEEKELTKPTFCFCKLLFSRFSLIKLVMYIRRRVQLGPIGSMRISGHGSIIAKSDFVNRLRI